MRSRDVLMLCALLLTDVQAIDYKNNEPFALMCDEKDPLAHVRNEFLIPTNSSDIPLIYLCGHSLGLQPKKCRLLLDEELNSWARLGVDGHFKEEAPWYSYHTLVRNSLANLVGALSEEVVAMNSLTVNLHLMMVSFYQPTEKRHKILMEEPVFSSDTYAVKSQLEFHGYAPDTALIIAQPKDGECCLSMKEIEQILDEQGESIAMVLFSAVNFLTGQYVDIERITKKAHEKGCIVGFDLAHAIGNLPLRLHDWDVDFAVWCSYKYLNSGPGAIGGAFVHERHHQNNSLNRFAGWWGTNPDTRFKLHLEPNFIPVSSADGWQLSNPSILALAPLRASLEVFDSADINKLRQKSILLTGYLEYLINQIAVPGLSIITPSDPNSRGCQLSIMVENRPDLLLQALHKAGIIVDFRPPNILRIAPSPLYNTFHEVWQFANILQTHLD